MAIDAQRMSVITARLDASQYERGAAQIERANEEIARSGAGVVRTQETQFRSSRALEQVLQRQERSLGLSVARQRDYERALSAVAQAEQRGLRTAQQAAEIRAGLEARYIGAARSTMALTAATNDNILASTRFRTVIQQAGYQVGDFAVQVASGGGALRAFVQQGSQMLGVFGPAGAIAGAALAIGGVVANLVLARNRMEDAAKATDTLEKSLRRLADASETAEQKQRGLHNEQRFGLRLAAAMSTAILQEAAALERSNIVRSQALIERLSEDQQRLAELRERGVAVPERFQRAETALSAALSRQGVAYERLAEITAEIDRVQRSAAAAIERVGTESARSSRQVRGLTETLEALNKRADEAATTLVQRLLREGETEWEKWHREVADATLAMERLANAGRITVEQQERVRRVLDSRSPGAVEARAAVQERMRVAEREAEEFARVWQRATDTAVERSGDYFFDLFTGRATDIGDALRNSLLRAVADAAANFLVRPIIAPVIGGIGSAVGGILGGSGSGGGVGALGNLLGLGSSAYQATTGQSLLGGLGLGSFMSTPIFGHSAAAAGMFAEAPASALGLSASQASVLAGAGPTFGAVLGAGGIGFGAGALLGAFGANRTTSSIGGAAIGAGAGFLIGGPVGAVVGALGGVAGGIFGGAKQGFEGGTSVLGIDPRTGQLTVLGDTGKRYDAGSIAAAVRPEVQQVNALLASGGIRISAAGLGFNPLSSTQPFAGYGPGQGDGAQYGGTVESVLLGLLGQGRLSSQNATVNRVLRSGGVTGLATLQEGLNFATLFDQLKAGADTTTELERAMKTLREQLAAAEAEAKKYGFAQGEVTRATRQAFERDIGRQILGITDPLKLALEDFDRSARARLEVARTLGADLVQVERLTQLQRKQIIEQNTPSAVAAPGGRGLSGLVDDVVFGGLSSGTDSQRFFAAQARYNQARRDALADPSDMEARATFESAARAALPIARDFLGTSARFGAFERDVLSVARRLDPAADPAQIAAQKIVDSQALAASLQVGATNAVRAEIIGLRNDFNRLSQIVQALARLAA